MFPFFLFSTPGARIAGLVVFLNLATGHAAGTLLSTGRDARTLVPANEAACVPANEAAGAPEARPLLAGNPVAEEDLRPPAGTSRNPPLPSLSEEANPPEGAVGAVNLAAEGRPPEAAPQTEQEVQAEFELRHDAELTLRFRMLPEFERRPDGGVFLFPTAHFYDNAMDGLTYRQISAENGGGRVPDLRVPDVSIFFASPGLGGGEGDAPLLSWPALFRERFPIFKGKVDDEYVHFLRFFVDCGGEEAEVFEDSFQNVADFVQAVREVGGEIVETEMFDDDAGDAAVQPGTRAVQITLVARRERQWRFDDPNADVALLRLQQLDLIR